MDPFTISHEPRAMTRVVRRPFTLTRWWPCR